VKSHQRLSNDSLSSVRHLLDADRLKSFFSAPGDLMPVADIAALRQFKSQLENNINDIESYYKLVTTNIPLVELENHYLKMREHEKFIQIFLDSKELVERYLVPLEPYNRGWKPRVCKYARTAAVWLPHFLDKANLIENILCALTTEQLADFNISEHKRQELLAIVKREQKALRDSIAERLAITPDEMKFNPAFVKNPLLNTYNILVKSMGGVQQAYKFDHVFDNSIEREVLQDALTPIDEMTFTISEMYDELLRLHRLESGARESGHIALSAEQIEIFSLLNQEELDFQIYASIVQKKSEDRAFFARILLSKYLPNLSYKQLFVYIIKHQPVLITYFLQFNQFIDSFSQLAELECFKPLFNSFSNGVIELNSDSFNELSKLFECYINRPHGIPKNQVDEAVADIDSLDNLRRANCYLLSLYRGPQPVMELILEPAPANEPEQERPRSSELNRELEAVPNPGSALPHLNEISTPILPSADAMEEQPVPAPAKSQGIFKRYPWIKWALLGAAIAAVIILAIVSYGGLTPLVGAAITVGSSMGLLNAAALGVGMAVICVSAVAVGAALLGGIRSIVGKVTGNKMNGVPPRPQSFQSSQASLIPQLQISSAAPAHEEISALSPESSPRTTPQVLPRSREHEQIVAPLSPSQKGKEEITARRTSFG
jgi:hypothetical protein